MKKCIRRITAFAGRVALEIIRDPLSYIFALGFPLIMLLIMTVVNSSIPPEAEMTLFETASLVPGIAVFGLTFMSLFTAILVSADRNEGFRVRLSVSPLRSGELVAGYILPIILLSIVQSMIAFAAGLLTGAVQGETVSIGNALFSIVVLIPADIMFAALGYIIGFVFSVKSAPAAASIVITASSLLGGIWMDADSLGGVWLDFCRALPFYHAVKSGRLAYAGTADGLLLSLSVTGLYALLISVIAAALSAANRRTH